MYIIVFSLIFFCINAHLFIILKSGNDRQHTAYGTLLNLTYRMPSPDTYSLPRKINGHMSHTSDLIVAASTGGFTYMLTAPQKKPKPKKTLATQQIAFISVCIHISTFSGPEQSGEHGNEPGGQAHRKLVTQSSSRPLPRV